MKIHFTILCLLLLTVCPAQANQDAVIVRLALVYAEAIDVAPTVGRNNADSGVSLFERKGGWKQIYFAEKPLIGRVRSYQVRENMTIKAAEIETRSDAHGFLSGWIEYMSMMRISSAWCSRPGRATIPMQCWMY